ncbi:unnamed protein product [Soboliphyme baturini]|uniref:Uncharacterized protein n=1 Tax=Soboliphyme baturini TaxID=241478 RepID=A0A183IIE4_9BILA|nr:unnamed protein product [Soboliphyme baturini]
MSNKSLVSADDQLDKTQGNAVTPNSADVITQRTSGHNEKTRNRCVLRNPYVVVAGSMLRDSFFSTFLYGSQH